MTGHQRTGGPSRRPQRRRATQLSFPNPDQATTIEGVLERFVFSNEESSWCVIRLQIEGQLEPVTAVGNLLGVQPGESLRLSGRWVQDPQYGHQFRVESFVSVHPSTLVGIERYLSSGLVQGIGKVMAKRLVEQFGIDTLRVIDTEGERLAEVPGIGPVRSQRILKAWEEQSQIREVMVFLQGHGVSATYAIKIFRRYGAQAVALVRENPYRLAVDIIGIGFKTADQIAANLGIAKDSPRRAEAGVLHTLGELSVEGHVYAPRPHLVQQAAETLEIDTALIEQAIDLLREQRRIVVEATATRATDATATATTTDQAVYLKPLHAAETRVAEHLSELLATPVRAIRIDIERALEWFEIQQQITLAPAQREAIRQALTRKLLLITGGPGTGKTTIVNALIRVFEKKDRQVLLCAPTGRAAKRMAETTGHEARTIHRMLEFSPREMRFERDRQNPLEADVVVIDELSMVDITLARHLLAAIPAHAQVIMVGDPDQLPSVGPGSVLRDLIASDAIAVVTLTEIFRQASRSLIVTNAHRVNQGHLPQLEQEETEPSAAGAEVTDATDAIPDFFFIERDDPAQAVDIIKQLVTERIPRRFQLHPVDQIQVLTPMHRGLLGATNLNAELQGLLTPPGPALSRGAASFRVGDKVMQIRNNYQLDVFNGDIGRVVAIDQEDLELVVRFEDHEVRYDRASLDDLMLAFACSIHKSQGSEYPAVVMPIHTQHYVMLQRNLLYTGITRGKRLVVVVGSKRALAMAVKNDRVAERWTGLAERLRRSATGPDGSGDSAGSGGDAT